MMYNAENSACIMYSKNYTNVIYFAFKYCACFCHSQYNHHQHYHWFEWLVNEDLSFPSLHVHVV